MNLRHIWTSSEWLSGFWNGTWGVAYHSVEWITPVASIAAPVTDWLLVVDQMASVRINRGERANAVVLPAGKGLPQGPGAELAYYGVTVNWVQAMAEYSNWAVAEVLVFEGELTPSQIATVERYISSKYIGER